MYNYIQTAATLTERQLQQYIYRQTAAVVQLHTVIIQTAAATAVQLKRDSCSSTTTDRQLRLYNYREEAAAAQQQTDSFSCTTTGTECCLSGFG
jgi:hypothetical protein